MARGKAETYYHVPREADGLKALDRNMYCELCRISSYDNDGYLAGGRVSIPLTVSQVLVSLSWLISRCRATEGQIRGALKRLKAGGFIIKINNEGFEGMRLFLPYQYKIRVKIKPDLALEYPDRLPEIKYRAMDTHSAGNEQGVIAEVSRRKASRGWGKKQTASGNEHSYNTHSAGNEQASNNSTKKEELRKKNKEQSIDDDDELSVIDLKKLARAKKRHYAFIERTKIWYLGMSNTPDKLSADDEKTLEQWMDDYDDYEINLSDVSLAFSEVQKRIPKSKRIMSLAYFSEEVFRAIKNRIDKSLA